jgi:hypothetical protein
MGIEKRKEEKKKKKINKNEKNKISWITFSCTFTCLVFPYVISIWHPISMLT